MALEFSNGDRIGKYRILRPLGAGGMGTVYHAVDDVTGLPVALKVLDPDAAVQPRRLERFRREALHMARLKHDNIVGLHEFGCADDRYYLALEYVDGIDLEGWVSQSGPLPSADAWHILLQLAMALDHAYERGVVHRDIKPSNILLTRREGRIQVKLADLGLALAAGAADSRLTSDGCTVGTLDYMAPEQARDSAQADTRSDIYSLGCTLFHLLAGAPPFAKGSVMERVVKHAKAPPPDLRDINPSVPDALSDVCRRMLAKRPADRFQTPAELLVALTGLAELLAQAPADAPAFLPPGGDDDARPTLETPRLTAASQSGHRRVALEQYQHACQALATGNHDYGLSLLLTCCQLDPADLNYRQALRQAQLQRQAAPRVRPLRSALRRGYYRAQFELARRLGRPHDVLRYGEDLLTDQPHDLTVQLAMAQAAEDAGLPELAIWLFEQARATAPAHVPALRALARLYEEQDDPRHARPLWEQVQRLDPADGEARRHIEHLLVRETTLTRPTPRRATRRGLIT